MVADRQLQGKRAELFIFGELLKRGVIPYVPITDVQGIDAVVVTLGGSLLTVQIESSDRNESPRRFQVDTVTPKDDFFIICLEATSVELGDVWVFPSIVFDAYAALPPKGHRRDLDLDSGTKKFGRPLREVLCGFRNRWELISNYEQYKELLGQPEDLEDVLTMYEALESPKEQMLSFDEYERRRNSAL